LNFGKVVDGVLLKKTSEIYIRKNDHILYRFVSKVINLSNKICHICD